MAPSDCGREGEPKQHADTPFAGPERLVIAVTVPVLARTATVAAPSVPISLTNTSSSVASVASASLDPLHRAESGLATVGDLSATIDAGEAAPGQTARITVAGRLPAKPGAYDSTLRVRSADGHVLSIPVLANVGASSIWGIVLLLLGLVTVGLLNLMDSESGVKGELRRVYAAREAKQDYFRHTEIPRDLAWLRSAIGSEYDSAVAALTAPRALSFVDHRPEDAKAHLDRAEKLDAELREKRKDVAGNGATGGLDIAEVEEDLQRLASVGTTLSQEFMGPLTEGTSLSQRVADFNRWVANRLLAPVLRLSSELKVQLERAKLLRAAGQLEDASAQVERVAANVKSRADELLKAADGLAYFGDALAMTLAEDRRLRQRADALPGKAGDDVKATLDQLPSMLAPERTWKAAQDAVLLVRHARTKLFEAQAVSLLAEASAIRARVKDEDSKAAIDSVTIRAAALKRGADGKIDAKERSAVMSSYVGAWRERLRTAAALYPRDLDRALAAMSSAAVANDTDAFKKHFADLESGWAQYSADRALAGVRAKAAPMCQSRRSDLLVDLARADREMQRIAVTQRSSDWDERLDSLKRRIGGTTDTKGDDCLKALLDLGREYDALSRELLSAQWRDKPLSVEERREVAAVLDPKDRAAFDSDIKPLRIRVQTPEADRYVGHEISFAVKGLADDWGRGVSVCVDFGDDKHETMNAEDLRRRRDNKVVHAYAAPKTFDVKVTTFPYGKGTNDCADTPKSKSELIGTGRIQGLVIAASPSVEARRLADLFFNTRFLLALAIAAAIYFWRFYARMPVFGANRFDYAEAFVIGFAVSLAVNQLPEKLAGLVKGYL